MPPLAASEVASLLHELGQRSLLRADNPYRARAYARAADSLLALPEPLESLVTGGRLQEIPGIGKTIAAMVAQLHRDGSHPLLDEMRREVPAGVLEMLDVPGLRAEKVAKLHRDLGIGSLDELERAARDDRIAGAKGLGPALQAAILRGIATLKEGRGQHHLHRAAALLEGAEAQLRRSMELTRVSAAGDVRRGCELVSDLALVAEVARLGGAPEQVSPPGQLAAWLTDRRRFGATLLLATGSADHIEALRGLAGERGMQLGPDGLRKGGRIVAARSEEEIYAALGLPCIPPELREGADEIALAQAGRLPDLVADSDIRGILHAHTDASDGADTLEAMAAATLAAGYGYFGVADHSRSAHYAGGLTVAEIEAQHAEIDRLNRRFGRRFRIFKGIESDILPDGSLDYPDEVLARFDFVVASVHSRFRMSRREQTDRIVRALRNPRTTILGHMTGRQLLRRPGYEIEVEEVLEACAAHGVAVEINANPWRLDLDWRWHRRALELGCMMSVNPDAHSVDEIALIRWGVAVARKGGVPKERVLNCLPRAEFTAWLKRRSAAGPHP